MSTEPTTQELVRAIPMSHREVLYALSGLALAMFVNMFSSTVVSTALPRIVADLGGSESGYTWVIVASLLTMAATTPIWGKLADLFSTKMLTQTSLAIFVIGSIVAGLAPNMTVLIIARLVQGIGMGGQTALVQVVIASMVTPRDRGRYFGYLGAVYAVSTVSGPLIGGVLVDAKWLGNVLPGYMSGDAWRWCFYVGIPFAVIAFAVLQKTLHIPTVKRDVVIDYFGALLITSGVSILLIWVSLGGTLFEWASVMTAWMVPLGILLLVAFVFVEFKVEEPIIPMRLFKDRTTSLAVFASVMIGVAMFGSTVFLVQYFQISRGMSPTHAGLMTLNLVAGLLSASIVSGRLIAATGRWKRYLVGGGALLFTGIGLLGTIRPGISLVTVGIYMAILGVGMGSVSQNLVLAVQNNAAQADMGAASSLTGLFRAFGGAVGVATLGAALGHKVSLGVHREFARIGVVPPEGRNGREIPDMSTLPDKIRPVFEIAFADATGHIFFLAAPFALLALLAILLIREVPLRQTIEREDELERLNVGLSAQPLSS